MSRNNTGNPIDSKAYADFEDNVKNLDQAMNSDAPNWADRFGERRFTMSEQDRRFRADQADRSAEFDADQAQRDQEFDADQSSREQEFRTFIASSGYQFAGDYAAGIEITQYNQLVRDENGEFWRVSGQVDLPYVTTGAGIPEDDALVPAGDAVLRQDLANPDMGAAMVGRGVVAVDSIADLLALPEGQRKAGLVYEVMSYHGGWEISDPYIGPVGGGVFSWQPGSTKVVDNIVVFGDGVTGRFIRRRSGGRVSVTDAGAKGDGVHDDFTAIQAAHTHYRVIEYPEPAVYYRTSQTVLLSKGQTLRGESKWGDWYLSADIPKGVVPDLGVAAYTTLKPGHSYPSAPPLSGDYARNLSFYGMAIQTRGAPCVRHHYSSNFLYDDCFMRADNSPALPMRYSYRGKIKNCCILVTNHAGYALELYDNCNAIDVTGSSYMTAGSIGGCIDISKSQSVHISGGVHEIVGRACIRVGGLTPAEAGDIAEVGNCNGITIDKNYFERCIEPISVGVAAACFGVVIQGNQSGQNGATDVYKSCITLGGGYGIVIKGNAFAKHTSEHPTILLEQLASSSPFRVATKVDYSANKAEKVDFTNGVDFAFGDSFNPALAGYVFGSGYFDFSNGSGMTATGAADSSRIVGMERSYTTSNINSDDPGSVIKVASATQCGGLVTSVEIIEASGNLDGSIRIGSATSSGKHAIVDMSGISLVDGYAKIVVANPLVSPGDAIRVQHVAGVGSGKFRFRVTYRI